MAEEKQVVEKKEPSTLSKSLNIGMDSMPSMGQTKEGREYAKTAQPLMDKAAEASGEVERAKMNQQSGMLGAQAQTSRQFGEQTKDLYQQAENKELEYPRPEFHPTKENAESLGQLFSMVSTFGIMLGGSGKLASQNALGAMGGMLQGWQKGRKDLYEREVREFDKEYKRVQDIRTDIQNRLQKSLQLASTDKETASLEAQQAVSIAGTNSIVGALVNQGKTQQALILLQTTQNIDTQVKTREQQAALAQQKMNQAESHFQQTMAAKGGKSASDRFGFGDIVAAASNESAAAIKNIMTLPLTSSSGMFGGRTTSSMLTAPLDVMANQLTSETVQRYNVEFGKLGYSLSQLMSGGRAVRVSDVTQMNNLLQIREGDTLETAATKIAEARQLAERTIQVRSKSSSTDPGLRDVFKENLETIETVVPFTVADINNFINKRDKEITFGESLSNRYKDKDSEKIAAPEGYEELK
jgi:hypothetical protein